MALLFKFNRLGFKIESKNFGHVLKNNLPSSKTNLVINNKRLFKTSPNRNAIPPFIWMFLKPISKLGAIILGRNFRTKIRSFDKLVIKTHLNQHKLRYLFGFGGLSAVGGGFFLSNYKQAPITNRRRFIMLNSKQLSTIEKMQKETMMQQYKEKILAQDSPYTKRALSVANRLFIANKDLTGVSNIEWNMTVIKSDIINAVCFPSGSVVVFTGLMDFVQNDDELATILSHEMAHAVLEHAAESMSQDQLLGLVSMSLVFLFWMIFPTDTGAIFLQKISDDLLKFLFELPYSRNIETEADSVGLIMAAKACFDVRYSAEFWKRMNEVEKDSEENKFLSTHPSHEQRAHDLEKLLPNALKLREECKCYSLPKEIKRIDYKLESKKLNKKVFVN